MTKWKSNFEINKELECKQLLWEKLEGKKLVYDILNNNDSNNRNNSENDSYAYE